MAALRRWERKLVKDRRAPGTVAMYVRDARAFVDFLTGKSGGRSARTAARESHPRSTVKVRRAGPEGVDPAPEELRRRYRKWKRAGSPRQRGIAWPLDRWIAEFPEHKAIFEGLPAHLDRAGVRDVARLAGEGPEPAQAAFVVASTWGYGTVGYGPHRTRRIFNTSPRAPELLHAVARTLADDGPVAAYGRLARDCRMKYLGPAFGTKYLAFSQPVGHPLAALIHDELVSSWLARSRLERVVGADLRGVPRADPRVGGRARVRRRDG